MPAAPALPGPLLALESSGRVLGAALWDAGGLRAERRDASGAKHGAALAPLARELLSQAGLKPRELGAVAVSLGPGSWTGLRIGLAAAKALAWGAGVALVGVPSLEALAWSVFRRHAAASGGGVTLATLRHAYSEGMYAALFSVTESGPVRLLEERVGRGPEWAQAFAGAKPDGPLTLCGDALCLEALAPEASAAGWSVRAGSDEVEAPALAERAWVLAGAGRLWRTPAEIHAAAPLYLRPSDPELNLLRVRPKTGSRDGFGAPGKRGEAAERDVSGRAYGEEANDASRSPPSEDGRETF
ncbi:MAG: tRNA (adenosine(37)-N6)-threonylcarbamoyltransferase complex dimerization subunit type 1 TsaB [Planctomycetota bacterium]|nr:tRNA (adenosine(37)-N6)-threonylcarbamoyltransferase complex dimerization subunit type 1 TsaB [Planctomycetota bacterium]